MTTNLSDSHNANAELDQVWAQWVADGARRERERQRSVSRFAIVIAILFAIWLTTFLIPG